jgi:2-keto-4-pentenoate hydratase/2-oxohepta-3-ene-1,7-dioic acid hydratase in catechol pathway
MEYVRFRSRVTGSDPRWGEVRDDGTVVPLTAAPWRSDHEPTGDPLPLADLQLLAPVEPSKLVAMALNYPTHLGERPAPTRPEAFLKAPTCVIAPGDEIVIPRGTTRVDAEGELVAVIGTRCRHVSPAAALDHVFGYTCGNDVSARDWQNGDKQWFRAKASDTFGPMGPKLVTGLDPAALDLRVRIDGVEVQASSTGEMIYDLPTIIASISEVMTLEPGDVIFTGTPGVPGQLTDGCTVEVEISGIGVLSNPVARET